MTRSKKGISVALLATKEATAGTLFGVYDLLASVQRDWQLLMTGNFGPQLFEPYIVAAETEPFRATNGVLIQPDHRLEDDTCPDIVCIPDMMIAPGQDLSSMFDREISYLRRQYDGGASLATACTGALMLAESGLLDGHEATLHWAFCDAMAKAYPAITVLPNRSLVVTGPEQRLIMAGGGTSWLDLALYLVAKFCGIEEAMRTARMHLIDWHDTGQQPFVVATSQRQTEDAAIARCQRWVADHYMEHTPVAAMEKESGLTGRSFKRRFKAATGMTPLEYVHTVRLEEAKEWLETSDMPIEAVAGEVGYEDPSFFSRMFRRRVGLTPAQYRKRFRSLRQTLQTAAAE